MRPTSPPLAVPTLAVTRGAIALPAAALGILVSHTAACAPCRRDTIASRAVETTTRRLRRRSYAAGLRSPMKTGRDNVAG